MAEVVRTGRDVRSKWRLREIQAGGAQISDVLLQRAEIMKRWFATPLIGHALGHQGRARDPA
jgi:hypothetical protein